MKSHGLIGILCLVLIGWALFPSCKKNADDTTPEELLIKDTTWWECNLVRMNPDTTRYFYLFSLVQNGTQLSGNAVVRDSTVPDPGIVTGYIRHDSVIFTADFNADDLNFNFRGVLDINATARSIDGSASSPLPTGGGDEQQVVITESLDFRCPDVFPDNPCIFRKVNSSGHPGDSAVIFIHGMTGDLTHWNAVVELLTASFKEKHDVYLFQYNWKDSIMTNGKRLLDSVTAAGLTNPVIVAHSMGGLVARAYISKGGPIARLVALGTPHLGTPLARLTKLICFLGFPGPQDMIPEGAFIQTLTNSANDQQNRIKYVVFGGQMKGSFRIVNYRLRWVWAEDYYDIVDKVGYDAFVLFKSPPNDGLVPLSSGLFEGYTVLERKPVLEWVDHKNLRNPSISTEVMDYINGL